MSIFLRTFCVLVLASVLVAASSIPQAWGLSDPIRLEQFIRERVDQAGIPGAAWVAVQDGSVSFSGTTGTKSVSSSEAITTQSPMAIGSVSKPFTAVAVMQLVEKGTVDLDSPVRSYVPYFELADETAASQITVRQLLSHTSGISTLSGNLSHWDMDDSPNALEQRVRSLAGVSPTGAPGAQWQYSNANYQVLGLLIEQISGLQYADYIEQQVFRPLGMQDSFVYAAPSGTTTVNGHQFFFGSLRQTSGKYMGRGSSPQGGLYVSASDLGLFLAAMVNGKNDVLRAETKDSMMQPQPGAPNFGLGWNLRNVEGRQLVFHEGQDPSGFETLATLLPDRQAAFAISANAISGFAIGNVRPVTLGASSVAFGIEPGPSGVRTINLALFIVLLTIPFLALLYLVFLFRRHRRGKLKRPDTVGGIVWKLLLPAILLLASAYALIFFVPSLFGVPISAVWLFSPDMAALLATSAILLTVVAIVRTLIYLTSNKFHRSTTAMADP